MKIDNNKIRVIPLGGVQEIGMNMTVIEYNDEVLVVDCGFMFPRCHMLGIDYVIPDTSYLEDKNIIGLIITHGHEDHIGAVPYFLDKFPNTKIYGSKLTVAFLQSKLNDKPNNYSNVTIYELEDRHKIKIGINFEIEFIRVNHSIPDGVGLAITTPLGVIIHTGDFKVDLNPTTDRFIDLYKFAEYGEKGVLLMLADSTNCQKDGFSVSESVIQENMTSLFNYDEGMIIVAVFASSIERIQDLVTAAKTNGKYVAFSGRSLDKYTKIAESLGYLNLYDVVIPVDKISRYPREKVVCITTGTQGEPYASLSLIAFQSHKYIKVEEGDMVIFSSSVIPGNEMAVTRVINNLSDLGAKITDDKRLLHVSGHASSEDLKLMYRLVKPKYFMPVHGEKRHLRTHLKLVENLNGLNAKGFLLFNGDVLEIDSNLNASIAEPIEIRNIYVDGKGVGDLEDSIFHDREQLSLNGVVVVNAVIKKNDINGYDIKIDIESKGFTYNGAVNENVASKNEQIMSEAKEAAKNAIMKLLNRNKKTPSTMKYEIREALKKKFMQTLGREPVIFACLYIDNQNNITNLENVSTIELSDDSNKISDTQNNKKEEKNIWNFKRNKKKTIKQMKQIKTLRKKITNIPIMKIKKSKKQVKNTL